MRKIAIVALIALLVLAAALVGFAHVWTEFLWFESLGFRSVFITVLGAQIGTGVVFGLIAFAALMLHVLLIRRHSSPRKDWVIVTPEGDIDLRDIVKKVSTPVVIAVALVVSAGLGYWASMHWEDFLRYANQTPFGRKEDILGRDVGFYVFGLPAITFVQQWAIYLTGICALFSAAVYFFRGAIVVEDRWPRMSRQVRGHLLFAVACVVAVVGLGYYIEMFETLFSKRGVAYGATYTDVHANLIAYRIMIVACVAVALFLLVQMRARTEGPRGLLPSGIALGVLFVLYGLGTFVWPTVVQRVVVNPNELEKEKPYIKRAIAGTQAGYGLEKVDVREFPARERLTVSALERNRTTIDNIKIWDHEPLRATYKQVQVIRLYYDFPSISVDRYWVNNRYWQVMLSARELVHEQLPPQSQTWVNKHLQYTHGYGVCLSPVNEAVGEGLPNLWVKDIPPVSRFPEVKVERPEIYYGMATDAFALVRTTTKEFDYPVGESNRYTTYQGNGGVGLGTFFRRLLFAIRFSDVNLVFTRHLTEESKILFNRQVQERVNAVAPFLILDQEPYMVVADGHLYWIQDAYTVSYRYPYSQPTYLDRRRHINYIRNSVKVVVDAFDGTLGFYIWDDQDPMVRTYAKIFPDLFKARAEMPASLAAHVRYPKDLFVIQMKMYESFHMTDPHVFYNQEDKWSVSKKPGDKGMVPIVPGPRSRGRGAPAAGGAPGQVDRTPYYMIMRLPKEEREEFLLMGQYTPSNKDNMVAWITAGCDGDRYGRIRVYVFPKQKLVFGPMQIEARIDQDNYISQWLTLRNQQGSKVIRGELLVIPIEESILYVEPVYLQAEQTRLPELKQVIVAHGKTVIMKRTLAAALAAVFGLAGEEEDEEGAGPGTAEAAARRERGEPPRAGSARTGERSTARQASALAQQAVQRYEAAQRRLSRGDWAGYGAEQRRLKKVLDDLAHALESRLRPRREAPASRPAGEKTTGGAGGSAPAAPAKGDQP